jgi:hypothetical protein
MVTVAPTVMGEFLYHSLGLALRDLTYKMGDRTGANLIGSIFKELIKYQDRT